MAKFLNPSSLRQKTLPEADTYIMRLTLQSIIGFMNSNDRGHIGLAFNIQDENHFDYVFFRWDLFLNKNK